MSTGAWVALGCALGLVASFHLVVAWWRRGPGKQYRSEGSDGSTLTGARRVRVHGIGLSYASPFLVLIVLTSSFHLSFPKSAFWALTAFAGSQLLIVAATFGWLLMRRDRGFD
jgi:Na+/H+ antiporter NhaC